MTDELKIRMLSVGHGDALLLTALVDSQPWSCLIDGGKSAKQLQDSLVDENVTSLDLLILSHFDHDHIGGLIGLTDKVKVKAYWGPALPAFDRHYWLFGDRIQKALDKAKDLEQELIGAGVEILYPLEGYKSAPFELGGPTLQVLSPPARLIRELITNDDIRSLHSGDEMPLGWLLDPPPEEIDQAGDVTSFDAAAQRGYLATSNFSERMRRRIPASEASPEFFGNPLVNNTSLVIWIGMRTEKKNHTLLLTGDLENWTYLLASYPRGLHADVLKASHHGGKVKLENELAHNEMLSQVRPRAVLVSGCGEHDLPHSDFRNAAIRWGSSVFCTSQRRLEKVSGTNAESKCCFKEHHCERRAGSVVLELDGNGVRANAVACHSGYGDGPGPVIQMEQHIIQPSLIVSRLFEEELSKHLKWMQRELRTLHETRRGLHRPELKGTLAVAAETLLNKADSSRQDRLAPHLSTLLTEGIRRRSFWVDESKRRGNASYLYALPTDGEISAFLKFLGTKNLLVFENGCKDAASLDPSSVLNCLETSGLALHANVITCYPYCLFREAIWPRVSAEFEKDWHGFLFRQTGTIAISKAETMEDLVGVLRVFLRANEHDKIIYYEPGYSWEHGDVLGYGRSSSKEESRPLTDHYQIVDIICEKSAPDFCPNFLSRMTQLW